ncbi:LADA_0F08680g1_1 [Lachancea dasiensis]|uniref:LADA_0F08680g1_1 n=1 Tax=Lachancea dasiensis TaxID=1072105 RepID=A0A1G4JKV3_9SACH|nr:LADA_0F08680g1_1 [Lachancea dasiensis]
MATEFKRYQDRYNTFCQTYNMRGKRCSWPYRVIPTKAVAQMGFEFRPIFKGEILSRDCVYCSFCGSETDDFHDCRVKPLAGTLCKVLAKHLQSNSSCLHSALKLTLIMSLWKGEQIIWSEHPLLGSPHSKEMFGLRRWTYQEGWIHDNEENLSIESMAKAGLLRYDLGLASPELQEEHPDATYCIYCSKIIGSWEPSDIPLWEHYVCSNGGQCLFFETMIDNDVVRRLRAQHVEQGLNNDENIFPSLDYYETFGTQLKKFEDQTSIEESQIKRGRPKSREINGPPSEPRKRGRPRKEKRIEDENGSLEERIDIGAGSGEVQIVKRKRGRPKKVNTMMAEKPKRPRGRPRKDATSSVKQDGKLSRESPPFSSNSNTTGLNETNIVPSIAADFDTIRSDSASPIPSRATQSASESNIDTALLNPEPVPTGIESGVLASPKRRIRIKQNQKLSMADDSELFEGDENSTKSIVLNFNNRSPSGPPKTRNPIIDDSFDAFSFSAHGNSEFVIPDSVFQSKLRAKEQNLPNSRQKATSDAGDHQSDGSSITERNLSSGSKSDSLPARVLDNIDLNVDISDDSEEEASSSEVNGGDATPRQIRSLDPVENFGRESTGNLSKYPITDRSNQASISEPAKNHLVLPEHSLHGIVLDPNHSPIALAKKLTEDSKTRLGTGTPGGLVVTDYGEPTISKKISQPSSDTKGNSSAKQSSYAALQPQTGMSTPNGPSQNSTGPRELFTDSAKVRDSLHKVDESRGLLANYFRKLLHYINVNDATLDNEKDGDLSFFVHHMPEVEKKLTFAAWIDMKKMELREEFNRDYQIKIATIEQQFTEAKNFFLELDNDDAILKLAELYNIPTTEK